MKDPIDNKTGDLLANTNAQRQAAFKARKLTEGFKRTTVWLKQADYDAGLLAAQLGSTNASDCPPDRDRLSWMLGYCTQLDRAAAARAEFQKAEADVEPLMEETLKDVDGWTA